MMSEWTQQDPVRQGSLDRLAWSQADHYQTLSYIESWLENQHSTIWGQGYDISQEQSRVNAAVWFLAQLESLHTHIEQLEDNRRSLQAAMQPRLF